MTLRQVIGRLLAVFLIVGLVTAPLVTPAAAQRLACVQMTDMTSMPGDMQCCPDGQKNSSCHSCPLVAICMLTILQAEPPLASSIQARVSTRILFLGFVDLIADGLAGAPPDHPPRSLI